ncbi:GNAT family N-acetyltransferase [Clostridium sp. P21]|uniref:GNAT family N-acetyltransferase n=1 Tax=Clostridium muellerianum TaxID=2716538 RepID=A0A7Y0EFF6_9CLOT|nr:GNAT family N-acetyltransferase [Clostridium muellerianum]NMM62524.1 GNAT family N-acetyltransferase [Clostridium muellerianum]
MIEEWKNSGEKLIPWSLNLDTTDIHSMVEKLHGYSKGIGLSDNFVESSTYWLIDKGNKVLGAIDIRHRLNENLSYRGGHIGYGIRPSERRKGYASKMLFLALYICKNVNISRVLITCSKDNVGSAKTIIKNGGVLDSEEMDSGEVFQRYWIELK